MGHEGFMQAFASGADLHDLPPLPGRLDTAGLPAADGGFLFATGIECSAPTIDHGRTRRDLLAECGHYAR